VKDDNQERERMWEGEKVRKEAGWG